MEWARQPKLEKYFLNLGHGNKARVVGHGVGLELNEPAMLAEHDCSVIHNGHTLAIDIHIMHSKEGVVKLENTVLVTPKGAKILSLSSRELLKIGG